MASFYGTVAGFKTYADDRGASYAGKTDGQIGQALVRASDNVDAYRDGFSGEKTGLRTQDREWPRTGAYDTADNLLDSTIVPAEVENATYEGAIRELAVAGSLNPDVPAGGGVLKRRKVGPLEREWAVNGSTQATFSRIDAMLAPLLGSSSSFSGSAVRA